MLTGALAVCALIALAGLIVTAVTLEGKGPRKPRCGQDWRSE